MTTWCLHRGNSVLASQACYPHAGVSKSVKASARSEAKVPHVLESVKGPADVSWSSSLADKTSMGSMEASD